MPFLRIIVPWLVLASELNRFSLSSSFVSETTLSTVTVSAAKTAEHKADIKKKTARRAIENNLSFTEMSAKTEHP
jgi:hypothetical protein